MKTLVIAAAAFAFAAPAAAFTNPNDFSWMRRDFDPTNYSWMTKGTKGAVSVPGMPITINNATYPPGWKLKPRKDGTFTLVPPKRGNGGGGKGKKGR